MKRLSGNSIEWPESYSAFPATARGGVHLKTPSSGTWKGPASARIEAAAISTSLGVPYDAFITVSPKAYRPTWMWPLSGGGEARNFFLFLHTVQSPALGVQQGEGHDILERSWLRAWFFYKHGVLALTFSKSPLEVFKVVVVPHVPGKKRV